MFNTNEECIGPMALVVVQWNLHEKCTSTFENGINQWFNNHVHYQLYNFEGLSARYATNPTGFTIALKRENAFLFVCFFCHRIA